MDSVNRIFAYLKQCPARAIVYQGKKGLSLNGYVDSDFAGCEDSRKSTTGWVFTMAGGPVSWKSQRQKTVATSTLDAEYVAAAEAAKEAVWIRNFVNDLKIPGIHVGEVPLHIDCNSALKLTRNPEFHAKSKHIDVKHHFVREKVESGEINTKRVGTKDNIADVLTKALARPLHDDLVERLGMTGRGPITLGKIVNLAKRVRNTDEENPQTSGDEDNESLGLIDGDTEDRHLKLVRFRDGQQRKRVRDEREEEIQNQLRETVARLRRTAQEAPAETDSGSRVSNEEIEDDSEASEHGQESKLVLQEFDPTTGKWEEALPRPGHSNWRDRERRESETPTHASPINELTGVIQIDDSDDKEVLVENSDIAHRVSQETDDFGDLEEDPEVLRSMVELAEGEEAKRLGSNGAQDTDEFGDVEDDSDFVRSMIDLTQKEEKKLQASGNDVRSTR